MTEVIFIVDDPDLDIDFDKWLKFGVFASLFTFVFYEWAIRFVSLGL